jgi:hypothetical protein
LLLLMLLLLPRNWLVSEADGLPAAPASRAKSELTTNVTAAARSHGGVDDSSAKRAQRFVTQAISVT